MLDRTLYIDRVGAFSFDRLACLRNEYAKNDCRLCVEQCAQNAFVFEGGKLRLSPQACTQCGACIGVCPTNALFLYGFSLEKAIALVASGETVFTCKDSLPCLGAFGVEEWISLLVDTKQNITCNLHACASCPINSKGTVKARIKEEVEEANAFVGELGLDVSVAIDENPTRKEPSRRAFFQRFIAPPTPAIHTPQAALFSLKKALKTSLQASHVMKKPFSFVHAKQIAQTCDNCKECVQFCPTNALSYNVDQTKILFQMGKCIGCHICEDICKKEAITSKEESYDIVHFVYDRADVLIAHDLQVCLTCKCAFSYKGGVKVCERCRSFEEEHADMFTLASEQES